MPALRRPPDRFWQVDVVPGAVPGGERDINLPKRAVATVLHRWPCVQVGSACHVAEFYQRYVASAFQEAPCPFVAPRNGDDIGPVLARELHRVTALAIEARCGNQGR